MSLKTLLAEANELAESGYEIGDARKRRKSSTRYTAPVIKSRSRDLGDGSFQREFEELAERMGDIEGVFKGIARQNRQLSKGAARKLTAEEFRSWGRKATITAEVEDSNTATLWHGSTGLFADHALQRDIVSTLVVPQGILGKLPSVGTVSEVTKVGILTGRVPDGAEEAATPCADGPSGSYTACIIDFAFGRLARSTQTIEFDKVIRRKDVGDTTLALIGQMLGGQGATGRFSMRNMSVSDMLETITKSEMVGVGVDFERVLSRMLWSGDSANNNVGGGYSEFPGLDMQITTGIVNANTSTACPAVDSQIADWEFADVSDTNATYGTIYQALADLEHYLYQFASSVGLSPVTWAIVMHPSLWRELTEFFPCMYMTNRCSSPITPGDANIVINAPDNVNMMDRLREGMYLPLNGRLVQVWLDDGITELDSDTNPDDLGDTGQPDYASTIYFLPLSIRGNFPATYLEYVDYRSDEALREIGLISPRNNFWSDDGVFSWTMEQVKWCYQLHAKVEPRVVLRTPQLAGKIVNVGYSPRRKVRSPYPGDITYLE